LRLGPRFTNATRAPTYEFSAGDALFIPCGWYHFIEYLTPGMSVSSFVMADWQYEREERCLEELEEREARELELDLEDEGLRDECMPHTCAGWAVRGTSHHDRTPATPARLRGKAPPCGM
jgi:hypothetical protein